MEPTQKLLLFPIPHTEIKRNGEEQIESEQSLLQDASLTFEYSRDRILFTSSDQLIFELMEQHETRRASNRK